ncbi:aspartyl-phosphate phosphatase Spo0E family protein [Natroniella acetigena]|nr:aspartyl-phosphate phosphatase Spo0E family protein [Natroniella acetigena]MCK8827311.1 aspartyl-phosphate phosphatase Spo0E family protein [Natroniella acetigena]
MKKKIEKLRQELIEVSSKQERIKLSQKLDKLILKYMKEKIN